VNGKYYSPEYKEQISKIIVEDKRKATEVGRELEIPISSLYKWTSAYKEKLNPTSERITFHTAVEVKKIEDDYQKQLRELMEENEILKKAMHIFAKNQ
jgi:transposase